MKKRAMIIAMMAAMLTVTSDCTVKLLHAEETHAGSACFSILFPSLPAIGLYM